jgi:hypothetical protein
MLRQFILFLLGWHPRRLPALTGMPESALAALQEAAEAEPALLTRKRTHRLTIGIENTDSSNHRGRTMVDEDEPRQGAPEVVSFAPTA